MNGRLSGGLFAVLMACSSELSAQALRFSDLEGYSIVTEYEEELITRRRGSFRAIWRDQIYFSTKGKIFHRFQRQGGRPGGDRNVEHVGDEDGRAEGRGAAFRWTGDGIAREWTNPRGVHVRHSISISPSGGGFTCQVAVDRSATRGSVIPLGRACRVFKGNILAG